MRAVLRDFLELEGLRVLEEGSCEGAPVILTTAFGGPVVADEAPHRGAARYLEKPFRVTQLLEAIRAVTKAKEAGS
ncbi:MAG: hypothetical protein HY725_16205 [Candidatus Rokubacteria bacterium]|nr:hypothetical protein [Candidatus Rokubacteria bacterium]